MNFPYNKCNTYIQYIHNDKNNTSFLVYSRKCSKIGSHHTFHMDHCSFTANYKSLIVTSFDQLICTGPSEFLSLWLLLMRRCTMTFPRTKGGREGS